MNQVVKYAAAGLTGAFIAWEVRSKQIYRAFAKASAAYFENEKKCNDESPKSNVENS